MICPRCRTTPAVGTAMTALFAAAAKLAKACSISTSLCTGDGTSPTPSAEAAASIAVTYWMLDGFPASKKTATRVKPGAHSLSAWSHLPPIA